MFSLLFLCRFSQFGSSTSDCEICDLAAQVGYLVYMMYGYDTSAGKNAMKEWCKVSFPKEKDHCNAIAVDRYQDFVSYYPTTYDEGEICTGMGLCPKPTQTPGRQVRPQIRAIEEKASEKLFAYLQSATTEADVQRLLASAPPALARTAKLIPATDTNLILMLLERNVKEMLVSYIRDHSRATPTDYSFGHSELLHMRSFFRI
jgi:hypothetical protein